LKEAGLGPSLHSAGLFGENSRDFGVRFADLLSKALSVPCNERLLDAVQSLRNTPTAQGDLMAGSAKAPNLEKEFLKAAKSGATSRVNELLDQNAALISARDADGSTPLHCAT
jgi:ankyrin repeat protein